MSILPITKIEDLTSIATTKTNINTLTISPLDDGWYYNNKYSQNNTQLGQQSLPLQIDTSQLNPITAATITAYNNIGRISVIKYVIAGNKQEYEAYIQKKGYSDSEYMYVDDASVLEGKHNVHGYYVGSWREREDIEDIKATIVACNLRF